MTHPILLNAGIGLWYSKGSDRLQRSFMDHGYTGEYNVWKHWPSWRYSHDCVYAVKAAALQHAMNAGFKLLVWADSSIYATAPVMPFFEQVERDGYWIGQSGYNCAQTCNDRSLEYFGITRDEAEKIPDCATGLFGLNLEWAKASNVARDWIQAAKDGVFEGSRQHGNQSKDPRFLFHRQDQAVMSLILGRYKIPLKQFQEHVRFKWDGDGGTFRCEGM